MSNIQFTVQNFNFVIKFQIEYCKVEDSNLKGPNCKWNIRRWPDCKQLAVGIIAEASFLTLCINNHCVMYKVKWKQESSKRPVTSYGWPLFWIGSFSLLEGQFSYKLQCNAASRPGEPHENIRKPIIATIGEPIIATSILNSGTYNTGLSREI